MVESGAFEIERTEIMKYVEIIPTLRRRAIARSYSLDPLRDLRSLSISGLRFPLLNITFGTSMWLEIRSHLIETLGD